MKGFLERLVLIILASSLAMACKAGGKVAGADQLFGAIVRNDAQQVRLLIAQGAEVNCRDANDVTPLALSARLSRREISELLLNSGADANIQSKMNDDIQDGGYTPLLWSIMNGGFETLQQMLKKGGDVNRASTEGDSPLIYAARGGFLDIVDLLLESGANPDYKNPYTGRTALMEAVDSGKSAVVECLVDKGVDMGKRDEYGNTLFMLAASGGQLAELMYLTELGKADLGAKNHSGDTALHLAIGDYWTYLRAQDFLCTEGADVDAKNNWGTTPLMEAASRGRPKTVGLLINRGAQVKAVDRAGNTPLHYAAKGFEDDRQISLSLINGGADVNATNAEGNTPLIIACRNSYANIVSAVLMAKPEINMKNSQGWTALMEAAKAGNLAILQMLLESGADPNQVNNDKETAASISKKFGRMKIHEYLSKERDK